jgi:ABC-type lipoprotein export system ATPase subunit
MWTCQKLDDRLGLEVNAKGHRFKLNRDFGGYHLTSREGPALDQPDPLVHLSIPHPDPLRHQGSLLEVESVSFSYEPNLPPVLKDVTLNIQPGMRLGFVGANGEGKTTFAKLIVGELMPTSGRIQRHRECKIGYFTQHQVDSLYATNKLATPVSTFRSTFPGTSESESRRFMGAFGIEGDIATQDIRTLSGGQMVRVAFALAVYSRPHLLVLDEVSNHLDMVRSKGQGRRSPSDCSTNSFLIANNRRHVRVTSSLPRSSHLDFSRPAICARCCTRSLGGSTGSYETIGGWHRRICGYCAAETTWLVYMIGPVQIGVSLSHLGASSALSLSCNRGINSRIQCLRAGLAEKMSRQTRNNNQSLPCRGASRHHYLTRDCCKR